MTRIIRATILTVLDGDEEFYEQLRSQGLLPDDEQTLAPDHVELARVTHTLVRELDVNWAGVEIVLRMRRELIDTRKQVSALLSLLQSSERKP
ncbi:MAG: hypothetical protein JWN48_3502 [Myxococcaceae bacterium]|nr:hypothetical protein [Myxococcaceae bacterium]